MARGQGILDVAMSAGKYCLLISLHIAICKTSAISPRPCAHAVHVRVLYLNDVKLMLSRLCPEALQAPSNDLKWTLIA